MISNKMDDMNFPSHFLNPMIDNDLKSAIYVDVSVAMTWHLQLYNGMSKPFVSAVFSIENYIFKFVRVKLRSHNDYNFQVERYIIPRWPYCISGTGPLYLIVFNKEITHNYENCKPKGGRFGRNIVCLYENVFPKFVPSTDTYLPWFCYQLFKTTMLDFFLT